MADDKRLVKELFDTVATLRDEVRVQANLARKDASDELQRMEKKWQRVDRERVRVQDVVEETATEALQGTRRILEELRDGYRRIRASK